MFVLGEGGWAAVLRPGHVKTGHQSYNGRIKNWKNKILIQILNFMFFRYKKINVFFCLFWCEIILLLFEVDFFSLDQKGDLEQIFLPWYDKSGFNPTNLLSKAKMAWTLLLSAVLKCLLVLSWWWRRQRTLWVDVCLFCVPLINFLHRIFLYPSGYSDVVWRFALSTMT